MAETKKVKVIEIEAHKLSPNSKYLIVLREDLWRGEDIRYLVEELKHLIGPRFTVALNIDPREALKVYEFAEEKKAKNG